MLSAAAGITLVLLMLAGLSGMLAVAARVQRARAERVERQIAVTDAIHRELGAVVAPVVTRHGRHRWTVAVTAPLDRPLAVGRILAIAYEVMAARRPAHPPEISFVLRPRAGLRGNPARVSS